MPVTANNNARAILVTGASGFVGSALVRHFHDHGIDDIRAGVRRPRGLHGDVNCDFDDPKSVEASLQGCDTGYFLVHGLNRGDDYAAWEARVAATFIDACARAGVRRVVYLGGPRVDAGASAHLRARQRSADVLKRDGERLGVEVVVLRAAVVLGAGSASFRLLRDVATRFLVVVDMPWLCTRQQPVAIDDVVVALAHARHATVAPGSYDVPGPQDVTGTELLLQMRRACGLPTWSVRLPVGSRRVAAALAGRLTRVDAAVARELVLGMGRGDLLSVDDGIWRLLPNHQRLTIPQALTRALQYDEATPMAAVYEGLLKAAVQLPGAARSLLFRRRA